MELDPQQLSQFDQQLAEREAELARSVHDEREEFSDPGTQGWPEVKDSVEDGDARMMASLELTQLRRNEHALGEVQEARRRIREGSYGFCEDCGEPIGVERLRAVPTARYCLPHEEQREREQAGQAR